MFAYLRRALSWLPTLAVLAGLVGVWLWGAAHDWKPATMLQWLFPRPADEKKKAADRAEENPSTSPGDVRLGSAEAGEQAGIEAAAARRQLPAATVEAPAVLAYDQTRYAQLAARAHGSAWRVIRNAGDRVSRGDVLALVSSPDASKTRADFLAALVQHDIKERTLTRYKSASGSIPESQVYNAQVTLREASVQLANAQQALVNLGLPVKLDALKGLSDDEVAARVRVLGLPANVQQEGDLPASLLPIVAPFDGLVIRRDLVEGEVTGPDKPAFVVADVARLWVQVDVRQEDVDRLEQGLAVTFESSTGQQAEGVLRWLSAEVDPRTRTVKARAEDVRNPDGKLRPATFGKARVHLGSKNAVITVPTGALQWDGQTRRVFVQRDGKTYEPRLVLPGATGNGHTELLDPRMLLGAGLVGQGRTPVGALGWARVAEAVLVPVAAGEKVATTGSHVLKSEMLKSRIGDAE